LPLRRFELCRGDRPAAVASNRSSSREVG
jgi:hypothetical protein